MELRIAVATLLLLSLLTCLSVSDAALATMSIDLGSQFMKMALVKPGVPMEIVLNKESRRKTPNLVTIRNGERLFGDEALANSVKFPQFAFGYLVNLLGKQADNPIVTQFKERFPFLNMTEDEERHTVQFVNNGETYSVESLLAMVLSHARKTVEAYAEQPVRDAVITVPAYFNQAERRALVTAAEIADINLLQLLNEHSAAGLNYGVFRRKEVTEQSKTMLIYDMGASKTTAAIVSYQIEKEKDSNEKNPQMRTLGFGYDRTLGGFEITHRLREFLVEAFRKQVKTRVDIRKTPRSMAKMLKEAERLKQVLSANADHFAQIENAHEEHDFRLKVHRSELEAMMVDLVPRMLQPIKDAMRMAEMDMKQIDQVVLMGAGTRTPKVKAVLQEFFKGKELGNLLNTDEAIAMGAVYQAAHLSQGFKVLKFGVHDLHIVPIQVDFMSHTVREGEQAKRIVHRPIFSYKSFYPSNRKILSFTSYDEDFGFSLNYGELKHLNEKQLSEFGSTRVSDIEMTGIADAVKAQMADEGTVMKGVKVRFSMDGSGIVHLESAAAIFEKAHKEESAFASIAGKFANLFSSGDKEEKDKENDEDPTKEEKLDSNKVDETAKEEEKKSEKQEEGQTDEKKKEHEKSGEGKEEQQETEKTKDGEKSTAEDGENKSKSEGSEKEKKEKVKEVKPTTVKVALKLTKTERDVTSLLEADMTSAKEILRKFDEREEAKEKRDEAQNKLEERVYDVSDKLEQTEFQKFVTESEKSAVMEQLKQARAWLEDEVDLDTTYEQFESKHQAIRDLLKPVNARIKYHKERPLVVADLVSLFNHTELFLALSANLTAAEVFSEVEVTTLRKLFTETKAWWTEKNATQQTLSPTDEPAYTISELKEKIRDLDREMKYLLNKMKFAKPKVAPKGNDTANANETESRKEETEGGSSEPQKESSDETGDEEKKDTTDSGDAESTGKEEEKTEEMKETAEDTTHTAEL